MKLEQQVCLKEQAIRLKELGVIQQSVAVWMDDELEFFKRPFYAWAQDKGINVACAFTVAELGQMLPQYYPSWRFLEEGGQNEFWIATIIGQPEGYTRDKEDVYDIRTVAAFDRYGKTQAEALAALLISLLETKTITAEEVNKRLQQ